MDPSTFYAQGNAEFVEERYAEAVSAYNVAIELADDQAAYFRARAAAHLKLGDFAAALEDSAAAVRLDVSNAMGHFRLGLANFYVGSFSDALASFKRASSLDASTVTADCFSKSSKLSHLSEFQTFRISASGMSSPLRSRLRYG